MYESDDESADFQQIDESPEITSLYFKVPAAVDQSPKLNLGTHVEKQRRYTNPSRLRTEQDEEQDYHRSKRLK